MSIRNHTFKNPDALPKAEFPKKRLFAARKTFLNRENPCPLALVLLGPLTKFPFAQSFVSVSVFRVRNELFGISPSPSNPSTLTSTLAFHLFHLTFLLLPPTSNLFPLSDCSTATLYNFTLRAPFFCFSEIPNHFLTKKAGLITVLSVLERVIERT
jgi:hypothetical protein